MIHVTRILSGMLAQKERRRVAALTMPLFFSRCLKSGDIDKLELQYRLCIRGVVFILISNQGWTESDSVENHYQFAWTLR